ncbi:M48 family metallopeptidase [Micrococcus porci]|uniref:M48 metallopeptidase family protein n=1 Tax=Micrococcus porci TaxID=2856555 RepID=UPI001CCCAB04|nr:M48 family metallopeptidase [Micrococcus porci]UBH23578.1 M48 family metallopeptidase [Micrococcus porci]
MSPSRTVTDLDWHGTPVRLVRSARRTRTVAAVWREGRLQVSVPARLSRAEERRWIERMVDRAGPAPAAHPAPSASAPSTGLGSAPDPRGDADLLARADALASAHLDGAAPGGRAPRPASVTWSSRQRQRWGSCTPARGTIRLSAQLRGMPDWVVDAVLVHELAHLSERGHGPRFQALVGRLPRYTEAMAFLAGVTYATSRGLPGAYPADADVADHARGWPGGDDDVVEG